jgi:hypothetical protein
MHAALAFRLRRVEGREVDLPVEDVEVHLVEGGRGLRDLLVGERDARNRRGQRRRRDHDVAGEGVDHRLGGGETEGVGQRGDLDESLALGDLAARGDGRVGQALQRAGRAGQRRFARVQAGSEIVDRKIGHL